MVHNWLNEAAMPRWIAGEVEQSLRRRIESGEWRQTRRLPNERELAVQYGVARNTVRSAIDRIVSDGALIREVGRGTFLSNDRDPDFQSVVRKLSGASPLDVMAVRMIVEPRAAALAAARGSASELEAVAAAHGSATHAIESGAFERWDAEFHQRIFAATRNELLNNVHELLRLIRSQDLWIELKRRSFSVERRLRYCDEHAAILAGLLKRHAEEASSAMLIHLQTVEENLASVPALSPSANTRLYSSARDPPEPAFRRK
jgi:DNA-binding FadR family transcriptional regulator